MQRVCYSLTRALTALRGWVRVDALSAGGELGMTPRCLRVGETLQAFLCQLDVELRARLGRVDRDGLIDDLETAAPVQAPELRAGSGPRPAVMTLRPASHLGVGYRLS